MAVCWFFLSSVPMFLVQFCSLWNSICFYDWLCATQVLHSEHPRGTLCELLDHTLQLFGFTFIMGEVKEDPVMATISESCPIMSATPESQSIMSTTSEP